METGTKIGVLALILVGVLFMFQLTEIHINKHSWNKHFKFTNANVDVCNNNKNICEKVCGGNLIKQCTAEVPPSCIEYCRINPDLNPIRIS